MQNTSDLDFTRESKQVHVQGVCKGLGLRKHQRVDSGSHFAHLTSIIVHMSAVVLFFLSSKEIIKGFSLIIFVFKA